MQNQGQSGWAHEIAELRKAERDRMTFSVTRPPKIVSGWPETDRRRVPSSRRRDTTSRSSATVVD